MSNDEKCFFSCIPAQTTFISISHLWFSCVSQWPAWDRADIWVLCGVPALCGLSMPPSPLDDRIVVALPRPIRPQELRLRLDTSYLETTVGTVGQSTVISSTTVVKIQAYMPSSSGSTRSLTCGCSSASCCTVSTYEKDGQVSASSPNLNSGVGYGIPTEAYSTPSLSSGLSRGGMRVIHPNELAKKLTHCPLGHPVGPVPVIIDCRPFMEFNKSHIRGAMHINCSDKISRRRLQQGKITVLDLISCRQSKDSFKGIFSKELVVYDESTVDPGRLTPSQPLHVVLESLRREGKDPIVLKGRPAFESEALERTGLQSIECFFFQRLESSQKKETL